MLKKVCIYVVSRIRLTVEDVSQALYMEKGQDSESLTQVTVGPQEDPLVNLTQVFPELTRKPIARMHDL